MSKATELFALKAPWMMELLMRDFSLSLDEAAAILGNLGHECGGFSLMQEQKPVVTGSRGGYGWAQWTGPRRRAFEAYCARNNLAPESDRANYGWLFVELSTSEKGAMPALKKAGTLGEKVKAFEQSFERAGVKHYASRNAWAARALDAYRAAGAIELPEWARAPVEPAPEIQPSPPPRRPDDAVLDTSARPNGSAGKAFGVIVLGAIAAVLYILFGVN
jgi:hypothetical protein